MVSNLPDTLFDKMMRFADMLGTINDTNILRTCECRIEDNIFVQRLAYIESSRYGMQMLFAKLFHDEIINQEMSEICKRWTKVKNDMIKVIVSKRLSLIQNLKEEIMTIVILEKTIYEKLNQLEDGMILMQQ